LLDHFEIEQSVFIGLSMGVPKGLAAVAQAPSLFSGLFLSDGQAKTAAGGGEQWQGRIDAARANGMPDYAKATACRWLAEPSGNRLAQLEEMMAGTGIEGLVACAQALADFDLDAVL
jgi:3-oxoadipate enol-lactonase